MTRIEIVLDTFRGVQNRNANVKYLYIKFIIKLFAIYKYVLVGILFHFSWKILMYLLL